MIASADTVDSSATKKKRVDNDQPNSQRAIKVAKLCADEREYYLLAGNKAHKLGAALTEDLSQLDSLTLSEDSDATRIYDLNSRETKILRHAIIKESRHPIGDVTPSPPTSPIDSEYLRRSPSFAVDKAIQQLTSSKRGSPKFVRRPIGKLKPNLFSETEARLKELESAVPKKLSIHQTSEANKKMADVEVAAANQPVIETQTHTQQSNNSESSVSTITDGNSVTNVESATEVSKAEHVVNETSTNETENGIELKEGVATSTAELVEYKELSTTEDGDRTVTSEALATSSLEKNESEVFTQSAWHPTTGAAPTNGELTNATGESASQVQSSEEVHRSESTVVTTEEDPQRNITRTITVTTSLVGVKHRILSESSELITSSGESLSITDAAGLKLALENGTLGALLTGQSGGDQPSPQIISELLKTPVIESPAGESPRTARHFKFPPTDVVVVSCVNSIHPIILGSSVHVLIKVIFCTSRAMEIRMKNLSSKKKYYLPCRRSGHWRSHSAPLN